MHTKEPWPEYLDVAVVMTPNPDGPDAAILSYDDYIRARACVNACVGLKTEELEGITILSEHGVHFHDSAMNVIKQEREELLSTLKLLHSAEWMVSNDCNESRAQIVDRVEEVLAKYGE